MSDSPKQEKEEIIEEEESEEEEEEEVEQKPTKKTVKTAQDNTLVFVLGGALAIGGLFLYFNGRKNPSQRDFPPVQEQREYRTIRELRKQEEQPIREIGRTESKPDCSAWYR